MIGCEEFWNKRSQIYDSQVGLEYKQANDKTAANTLKYLKPSDRVLDFACGTGLITVQIAPHVAELRGIDISAEMVRRSQNKVAELDLQNVKITQTGIFDPCLEPGSFDAITAFNVLCYVDNLDEVLARIHSLLKPGGYFLSATDCLASSVSAIGIKKFVRSHTGRMPYVAFFRTSGLERIIANAGFRVLERENLFRSPPNLFIASQV